jgi:hypothetical protein
VENNQDIDMVFFDIGGMLDERHPTTGLFKPFPSSADLLKAMREVVGLRIGVITALWPGLTNTEGLALLQGAGIAQFLDLQGFVSDHDAGVAKPHVAIYQVAAQRVVMPIGCCLSVGENLIEVLRGLGGRNEGRPETLPSWPGGIGLTSAQYSPGPRVGHSAMIAGRAFTLRGGSRGNAQACRYGDAVKRMRLTVPSGYRT